MNSRWSPTRIGDTSSSSPEMPNRRRSSCSGTHGRLLMNRRSWAVVQVVAGRAPLAVGGRLPGPWAPRRAAGRCSGRGRGVRGGPRLGVDDRGAATYGDGRGARDGRRGDWRPWARVRAVRAQRDGGGPRSRTPAGVLPFAGAAGRSGAGRVVRGSRAGRVRVGVTAVAAAPAHRLERRGLWASAGRSVMLGSSVRPGFPSDRRMIPRGVPAPRRSGAAGRGQPLTTSRSRVASLSTIGPDSPQTTMSSIRAP